VRPIYGREILWPAVRVGGHRGGLRRLLCGAYALFLIVGIVAPAASLATPSRSDRARPTRSFRRQPLVRRVDGDSIVVRPAPGTNLSAVATSLERIGGSVSGTIGETEFAEVSVAPGRVDAVLQAARSLPGIAVAEPNFVRSAFAGAKISGDPQDYLFQKHEQDYLRTIRMPNAWHVGHVIPGFKVAVLDSGVDLDHPDLSAALVAGTDTVNGDSSAQDDNGHGTGVAGVLGAVNDNVVGVAGVAWGASIMPVKVLDATGHGTDSQIAAGITWAVDNGARVLNMSFGGPGDSKLLHDAVAYAASRGVVMVGAAGNSGTDAPSYPGAYPEVIDVGATDWSGNVAWYSSFGSALDVVAPGWLIATTALSPEVGARYDAGYARGVIGTSYAAPVVAGVAALVASQNPTWTATQVTERVLASARDAGPAGIDRFYGRGVVDAYAAVGGPPLPPTSPPAPDSMEPNDVPDRATRLTPDVAKFGTFAPEGDIDWYYADLSAGGYQFSLNPENSITFRPLDSDVYVRVYDSNLRILQTLDARSRSFGEDEVLDFSSTGRYYFQVRNLLPSRVGGDYGMVLRSGAPSDAPTRWSVEHPNYYLDAEPLSTAVADVTGDGRKDVLVSVGPSEGPPFGYNLLVFPQSDDGLLAETPIVLPAQAPGAGRSLGIATGDLNGDGKTDAALAVAAGVQVYLQGASGLQASTTVPGPFGNEQVEIADVDRDGRQDMVTLAMFDETLVGLYYWRNLGSGWDITRISTAPHGEVELGDVTGDGRIDIVANQGLSGSSARVDVFPQSSTGSFGSPVASDAPQKIDALDVGDVTGDGRKDIVASGVARDFTTGNVQLYVFRQTTTGTLAIPATYSGGISVPHVVEIADFDRDGRNDVLAEDLYLQSSAGTLQRSDTPPLALGTRPQDLKPKGLSVGDFTGDGYPDAATIDRLGRALRVLRQRTGAWPLPEWVRDSTPADFSAGIAGTVRPTIRFNRALDGASVTSASVKLVNATTNTFVAQTPSYDPAARSVTIVPSSPLVAGASYRVAVGAVRDTQGNAFTAGYSYVFTVAGGVADRTPPDTLLTIAPYGAVYPTAGHWDFYASEPGTLFECSFTGLGGGATGWIPCAVPMGMGTDQNDEGPRSFAVRAIDGAGNVDPTPATRTWMSSRIQAPNARLDTAQTISGSFGRVTGSNAGGGGMPQPTTFDNPGGLDIWYRWTAPSTGKVMFDTSGSDFDTLLVVGTTSDNFTLDNRFGENDDASLDGSSAVTFDAVAGTTYYIGVDGYNRYFTANGNLLLNWFMGGCTVTGTIGPNKLVGTAGADRICGLAGGDTIYGLGGDDILIGGDGDDVIFPGAGNDLRVEGGLGTDTLSYSELATAGVTVALPGTTSGAAGVDTIRGFENVTGTSFADTLGGDAGNNWLNGLGGNDTLDGGPGTDRLDGGEGTDACTDPQGGQFLNCP
jgi:serine protease